MTFEDLLRFGGAKQVEEAVQVQVADTLISGDFTLDTSLSQRT
jgi:hypothetical protein